MTSRREQLATPTPRERHFWAVLNWPPIQSQGSLGPDSHVSPLWHSAMLWCSSSVKESLLLSLAKNENFRAICLFRFRLFGFHFAYAYVCILSCLWAHVCVQGYMYTCLHMWKLENIKCLPFSTLNTEAGPLTEPKALWGGYPTSQLLCPPCPWIMGVGHAHFH